MSKTKTSVLKETLYLTDDVERNMNVEISVARNGKDVERNAQNVERNLRIVERNKNSLTDSRVERNTHKHTLLDDESLTNSDKRLKIDADPQSGSRTVSTEKRLKIDADPHSGSRMVRAERRSSRVSKPTNPFAIDGVSYAC